MAEQRQPEIDSLRGSAVMLVLFDHFGLNKLYGFPWGIVGVKLLFVFSGYFITRLILKEILPGNGSFDLPAFYRKRVLRLVPVLYVAVLIGVLFDLDGARAYWGWHLGFATNYLVMATGEWPGAFSHFWSLGLQMQFYIVWPMLMVWLPARARGWAIASCFFIAFAFRSLMLGSGANEYMRWLHLPGTLDAFAVGALVAWIEKERTGWIDRLRLWRYAGIPLAFAALWGAIRLRETWPHGPAHAGLETLECLFLGWLFFSIRLRVNPFAPLLRLPGLPAVGTVSFGLYAFHPLVQNACARWLFPHMGELARFPGMQGALLIILSLGAAALCHLTVERKAVAWIAAGVERVADAMRTFSAENTGRGFGLGRARLSGAFSALLALGVVAGPIVGFHREPQPDATGAERSVSPSLDALASGGSIGASPGQIVDGAAVEFIEPLPEFDWGYLPFGQMYDQAPARDIEVTTLDEIEVLDEA